MAMNELDVNTSSVEDANTQLQVLDNPTQSSRFPSVPLNDMGLPTGFYRGDMVSTPDPNEVSENVDKFIDKQESYKHAFVPLAYHEGFPTLPNGNPYWNQFDHEPIDDYQLFDIYMQLPTLGEGARSLAFLPKLITQHLQRDITVKYLQQIFDLYYWHYRAKAYDLFREAARRKQLEMRALDVNNNHYVLATRLMNKLEIFFENEADFWDLMTPKTAIDFLKTLTQLQRVSVGMPAAGPLNNQGDNENPSFEMTLRTIAQSNHDDTTTDAQNNQAVNAALSDPNLASLAQELIIKLGSGTKQQ